MNDIAVFTYTDHEVRAVMGEDGVIRLVGADVTTALGYAGGGRNALSQLPDRMRGVEEINTPGGLQKVTVITESGVYRLVMRSNLPSAEAFQDWIAEEVVPSIRRTGQYGAPVALPDRRALALMVIEAEDRADRAEAVVAELSPSAEAWDTLATAEGDYAVADAAKILCRHPLIKIGRDRLFTLMSKFEPAWIYRRTSDGRWTDKQYAVDAGWLTELPSSHYHPRTGVLVLDPPQVRVTVKGLAELQKRLTGTQDPLPSL